MRVMIQFDECKPHWAKQRGFDRIAEDLGLTGVTITGDFDAKIAYVIGETNQEWAALKARFDVSPLAAEGSLYRYGTNAEEDL